MRNNKLTIFVGILAFFLGACALYLVIYFFPDDDTKTIINKSEKEVTITDKGIADAVEKIFDAVVVVENYRQNRLYGSGTGFFYKVEGNKAYILTNFHVVNKQEKVYIILTDGEKIEAKVVGSDQFNDVAVMSVDAKHAKQVAIIGDSEESRLGDTVFTVGAPLDNKYSGTVTRGVISGKDRLIDVNTTSIFSADYMMRVIQTDASINSGNSGGPLVNSNGEVIGINSSKLVSSGVEGMGFAIPIEDAIQFAKVLEKGEKIIRPSLGVSIFDVGQNIFFNTFEIDPDITEGAVISAVVDEYPAKESGLKPGDVILQIDNYKIESVASLKYYLYKYKVGDSPNFKINRNGEELTIKVNLNKAVE